MNCRRRAIIAGDQRAEASGQRSDQRLISVVCRPPSVFSGLSSVVRPPSSVFGRQAAAFTLIELLVSVALLGMAMAMTFTTFYSVSKAWQRGTAMADDLDHGEYAMEQIACGLRSSFFPPSATKPRVAGTGLCWKIMEAGKAPGTSSAGLKPAPRF